MSTSSLAIDISKVNAEQRITVEDYVAVEEPLEIQLGTASAAGAAAKSISITMRTPGHDVDLALGFLYTEAIITSAGQVKTADFSGPADAETGLRNIVRVELEADVEIDLGRLQRHFYTTSSCGVCGKSSIDALRVTGCDSLTGKGATYPRQLILDLPDKLSQQQQLFSQTGGLHAAAIFDERGEIICVREDVGRHNAVDKVTAHCFSRAGCRPQTSAWWYRAEQASSWCKRRWWPVCQHWSQSARHRAWPWHWRKNTI